VSDSRLYGWAAVAGFVSAGAIILGKVLMLLENKAPGEISDFFSPLFGLLAIVAVYLWQRDEAGLSGAIGFVVVFVGLALVTSLDFFGAFIRLELPEAMRDELLEGNPGIALGVSAVVFLTGVIWFGISLIRSGVYPRPAGWMFIVGFVLIPLGDAVPTWVVVAGSIIAGLSVAWLSFELRRQAGEEPSTTGSERLERQLA
jgi:hypothetical protein